MEMNSVSTNDMVLPASSSTTSAASTFPNELEAVSKPSRIQAKETEFRNEFDAHDDEDQSLARSIVSIHDDESSASSRISGEGHQQYTDSSTSSQNYKNDEAKSRNKDKEEEQFVRRETQQVFCLRIVVVAILMCAGAAVSLVVYLITSNAETDEFESSFQSAARKITDTFLAIPTVNIGAVGALVVANVAHGVDHFREWPFVTLSSFQQRSDATKRLSLALQTCVAPIVTRENRAEWEFFSNNSSLREEWFTDGIDYQVERGSMQLDTRTRIPVAPGEDLDLSSGVGSRIFHYGFEEGDEAHVSSDKDMYLPVYQISPISLAGDVNMDLLSTSTFAAFTVENAAVVFGRLHRDPPGPSNSSNPRIALMATLISFASDKKAMYEGDAYSMVFLPLFHDFSPERKVVGVMRVMIQWGRYFRDILPDERNGIIVVLENECDAPFTYQIDGAIVTALGTGDLHDSSFGYLKQKASLQGIDRIEDGTAFGMSLYHGKCPYSISVYPSTSMENDYKSNTPIVMTFSVAMVFLLTIFMFFVYDRLVERRQRLILKKAERTNAIVSSLFPKTVRERLMEETTNNDQQKKKGLFLAGQQHRQMENGDFDPHVGPAPIADLFPHATVLFADIAGFTAWSSTREPAQVFTLLQAVYKEFDSIAHKRNVFKVETIGDSYVAVTGLPDPQPLHFIIMARFAQDCMVQMDYIVKKLEKSLGPDTGDLKMRFGLHSGPVTGGVLAGERSRFQLFGDTVNTAARMESTGAPCKIHCSQTTAELLMGAGKGHWVTPREGAVEAKGKGVLRTFWVHPRANKPTSETATSKSGSSNENSDGNELQLLDPQVEKAQKQKRLVDWMTELMVEYVKPIVAKRSAVGAKHSWASKSSQVWAPKAGSSPIDELVEIIQLAPFDENMVDAVIERPNATVPDEIRELVREYVAAIAMTYRDNPFHNFEHACHVTMSVAKFLKRVVAPKVNSTQLEKWKQGYTDAKEVHSHMHDYTHGIHGDTLALFAMVFSALIHDADHRGVSNVQLIKEDQHLAMIFKNQSVAEQNSLDIAWKLFASDQFEKLRMFLCPTQIELRRFRQIIVNIVLATDIFDKELNELRKVRWNKAFADDGKHQVPASHENDLRATIVIEHIIQASDVSHTMQHWHIYQKWNKRLFQEMLMAYRDGRMAVDPATFWYQGELGFFDNYIIPLAKKLEECNVFGVSSDECLIYAKRNRDEWAARGEDQVASMVEEFQYIYKGKAPVGEETAPPKGLITRNDQSIQEA
ncbi:hypothetical protein ACA910_016606 [Epithemia clementina (nom. ined.)]